jgi:tetratricopeptide (TPR) repeat protein
VTLRIGSVRVDDLRYPEITADDFAVAPFTEPKQRREQTARGLDHVIEFTTSLTPLKEGVLTIGPVTAALSVAVPNARRRSPFGGIFGEEMRPTQVASDPVTLTVLPLPEQGRPPDFSGAVGEFTLDVTVSPRELDVGDPITVKSLLRGSGNLDGLTAPSIAASDRLRVYPVQTSREDERGARTFEQAVVPLRDGPFLLDGPAFSYFDPRARAYRRLVPEPVSIRVRASASAGAQPQIIGAAPQTTEAKRGETLGRDLVFIKDAPGPLRPLGARLYERETFWLAQLVPLFAWFGAASYDRRRRRLAGDTRYARFTRAGRSARADITKARAALAGGDLGACRDLAAAAIRDYLAAKLDLPPGAVEETAASRLEAAGVDTSVVERVRGFFAACEHSRFAPRAVTRTDIETTLAQAEAILRDLERTRRIKVAAVVSVAMAAIALTNGVVAHAAATDDNPTALFFRANALYSAEQYAEASTLYEKVLAAGVESGAVYFNLGNAYFKAGDVGRAVLSYERAARMIPSDPDLAANLAYARELAGDAPVDSLLTRVLFPLAGRLDTEHLLLLAALGWWTMLLALTVSRFVPAVESALRWTASVAAVILALGLSSAAFRYRTTELPRWGVVTATAETTVRYEPSPSGTAFFAARPGTVLRIVGEREGWLQVAGRDGRRGWIDATMVSRL